MISLIVLIAAGSEKTTFRHGMTSTLLFHGHYLISRNAEGCALPVAYQGSWTVRVGSTDRAMPPNGTGQLGIGYRGAVVRDTWHYVEGFVSGRSYRAVPFLRRRHRLLFTNWEAVEPFTQCSFEDASEEVMGKYFEQLHGPTERMMMMELMLGALVRLPRVSDHCPGQVGEQYRLCKRGRCEPFLHIWRRVQERGCRNSFAEPSRLQRQWSGW